MEFLDIMSISHRYMEILNPSTPEDHQTWQITQIEKRKPGH